LEDAYYYGGGKRKYRPRLLEDSKHRQRLLTDSRPITGERKAAVQGNRSIQTTGPSASGAAATAKIAALSVPHVDGADGSAADGALVIVSAPVKAAPRGSRKRARSTAAPSSSSKQSAGAAPQKQRRIGKSNKQMDTLQRAKKLSWSDVLQLRDLQAAAPARWPTTEAQK
jgi:hypothetical protein